MAFPSHISDIQPFLELHVSSWASVYKAYQPSLDRVVLLKVLNPVFSKEEENAAWFKSEAQMTAKVKHPNVVAVYSYGESKDGLYFTTEFVDGITLREAINRGPIPYPIAVFILEQMVLGLQAAHKQGVLHRDLKPENVLISLDGYVKLCDFGFASQVNARGEQADVRGTIGYIAPEAILEGVSGEEADVFSLGAIFYELLLGIAAYEAEDLNAYLNGVQHHDPIPLLESYSFIPAGIRDLCGKLLKKDRAERFKAADGVIKAIREIQQVENLHVSHDVLSEWWSAPNTYQIPTYSSTPELDNPAPAKQEGRNEGNNLRWAWRFSVAALLIVIAVAFINGGFTKQAAIPAADTPEVSTINSVETSPISDDSLDVEAVDLGAAGTAERAQLEPETVKVQPPPVVEVIEDSEPVSPVDSIEAHVDSLDQVTPGEGFLTVLCLPSCSVHVGEEDMGKAPPALTMPLEAGTHQVLLKNADFPPYKQEVDILNGINDTLKVSLLASVGTLDLVVIPWGEVFIDSTSYGIFPPARPLKVWPGQHTLRVVHKELGEQTLTFTITQNERLTRTINLTKN